MKKIGIYGGSFNPVHSEHINISKAFIKELDLDILYIIPTNIAPHKQGEEVCDAKDRLNMLSLAFKGVNKVQISSYELDKGGVSYTYLTIEHFKNLHQNAQIYFLVGSDMLDDFPTWKNPQEISKNANLVLAYRKGDNFDNDELILKVKNLYDAKVIKLNYTPLELSSSFIRGAVKLGIDIKDKIPLKVYDYIIKNNLYSGNEFYNFVKNTLPEKRKIHTLGVILLALKFAKKMGIDLKKAELSALLHDIAKYEDYKKYKDFKLEENCPSEIIHQYLGAYIAKNSLRVEDEEVIEAIKYHTTGKGDMSALQKIIYIADLIEPSRKFNGVDDLRKAVEKDFEKGFIISLNEILDFLKKSNQTIHPLTIEAVNYYNNKEKIL